MASHRRGPWSQGEDSYLVQLVHTQGALNWVRIAQLIGSRSPKQCRERYHQNLKPSLNHEPISPEEGLLIERLVGEMGKRWAEIARRLNGRSDNAVKNWWNGSMNRRRRLVLRRRTSTHCPNTFDERTQSLSFARPAAGSALTISSSKLPSHRGMDGSLPSPAVSEASRAESVDGAPPSLVSDSGSAFSMSSPRLRTSPNLELPPLYSQQASQRPNPPTFQYSSGHRLSEPENQAHIYVSQSQTEPKAYGQSALSPPVYRRADQHTIPPLSPRDTSLDIRGQLLTAPSTPVQLAPLQLNRRPDRASERDSRMHLSSLLG